LPEKRPETFTIHGDNRVDEYNWLRNREDPKVLEYLKKENEYADAFMAPHKKLRDQLYKEMKARMKEDDMSVPTKDGPYYYYTRTKKGQQYAIHCRRKGLRGKEEDYSG
jgi:oligopeptidase B